MARKPRPDTMSAGNAKPPPNKVGKPAPTKKTSKGSKPTKSQKGAKGAMASAKKAQRY